MMKKALLPLLILLVLPCVHAQEGLLVPQHNLTYYLGEDYIYVEEVIIFENIGRATGNLFRDSLYFVRGDAWDVDVDVTGETPRYKVERGEFTTITVDLTFWKGESRRVAMSYRRSDILYKGEGVNTLSGLALGKYPWIVGKTALKFVAPKGYQFGNLTPSAEVVEERGQETITYEAKPITVKELTAINEGFPVTIEYANYIELAEGQIKRAEDFVPEGEFHVSDANISIENAKGYDVGLTAALGAYAEAQELLEEAKTQLQLARIKNNPNYEEYYPYEAYSHALASVKLAKEASRKAAEAKNLANFEIQAALQKEISKIEGSLEEKSRRFEEGMVLLKEEKPKRNYYGIVLILILALGLLGALKTIKRERKRRGTVEDFTVIGDLKRKTFVDFEKKADTVKKGVEIAREIRALRREREKLDLGMENLRKKKISGEISEKAYKSEKEKLEERIGETATRIYKLEGKLKEIKRAGR
jgi:exonuclease VII small subunit